MNPDVTLEDLGRKLDVMAAMLTKDAADRIEELKIPCEVYSRVVGYLRPVQDWNIGKQQEFVDRVPYKMPEGVPPSEASQDGAEE